MHIDTNARDVVRDVGDIKDIFEANWRQSFLSPKREIMATPAVAPEPMDAGRSLRESSSKSRPANRAQGQAHPQGQGQSQGQSHSQSQAKAPAQAEAQAKALEPSETAADHLHSPREDLLDIPDHLRTDTERAPITFQRRIDPYYLDDMDRPYVPRALVAADKQHPHGTPGYPHRNMTVMQQHVAFFDRNHDGVIYPWETYSGFRAIGYNILVSLWAASLIHFFMAYKTQDSWIPHPLFPIYIINIHRCKHASDSDIYDPEGRFVPAKFEELFEKFAKTRRGALTFGELLDMTSANQDTFDALGWAAAKLEWGFTYWTVKDSDGFVPKDAVRGVFDGSIFYHLENMHQERKLKPKYV